MVNGNYSVYGDRPSSETEYVNDHIRSSITTERKSKRTNELQNMVDQLDNETDSVKFEKKIKEPRLLRYVPTTDVEENFVAEKFETYDIKGTEAKPRRHPYTKKARNPSDGSVNYGYSRSSSSSPNLPTISEHSEQYSTYRIKPNIDEKCSFENKFDKYFMRTIETKNKYDGTHPDSLYRVGGPGAGGAEAGSGRTARALRAMRWPAALIVVCAALGLFVYFLMPNNTTNSSDNVNSTVWETGVSSAVSSAPQQHRKTESSTAMRGGFTKRPISTPHSITTTRQNTEQNTEDTTVHVDKTTKKPIEIDFYHPEVTSDVLSVVDSVSGDQKLLVPPIYPDHITPEVQYGGQDKRTPKLYDDKNKLPEDSTLKPHITQKPEKPLAIFFKNTLPTTTPESLNLSESGTISDLAFIEKLLESNTEDALKHQLTLEDLLYPDRLTKQFSDANFTSGHSKIFGVGIEEVDKMRSTTQSSTYKTRVSPTLPTWRNTPDSTTKNYPVNITDVSHCHSTRVRYCRGALPYDLVGPPINLEGLPFNVILSDMNMFYNSSCSSRLRQFVCSLLEPECQPLGSPPMKPCLNLCKIIRGLCLHVFPRLVAHFLNCEDEYTETDCSEMLQPCYAEEVPCKDGTCVHKGMLCDGYKDCPNGVDEQGCGSCLESQYKCPSTGECIAKTWMCDGVNDCANAEDEYSAECKKNGIPDFEEVKPFDFTNEKYSTEPGGQAEGSSPVKTVTTYGRLNSRKHKIDESSKELLETSDTSNALKRNYTRLQNPSQSRLRPYIKAPTLERTLPPMPLDYMTLETTSHPETRKLFRKKSPGPDARREDRENVGLLDSYENEGIDKNQLGKQARPKVQKVFRSETNENKTSDYLERHINPKAMVEAQIKEEDEERAKKLRQPPEEMMVEKVEPVVGARSPCPAGELRCVDGRCITLGMLCDGHIDCSDHADEDNCFT